MTFSQVAVELSTPPADAGARAFTTTDLSRPNLFERDTRSHRRQQPPCSPVKGRWQDPLRRESSILPRSFPRQNALARTHTLERESYTSRPNRDNHKGQRSRTLGKNQRRNVPC